MNKRGQKPPVEPAPAERVKTCEAIIQRALLEHRCQMWTVLKIGNAEPPIGEVAGFPIMVKLGARE